jgi:hypothetical protein
MDGFDVRCLEMSPFPPIVHPLTFPPALYIQPINFGKSNQLAHRQILDLDNVTSSVVVGSKGVLTFQKMILQVGHRDGRHRLVGIGWPISI